MKKTYATPVTIPAGNVVRETMGNGSIRVEDGVFRNQTGSVGYNL